MKSMLTRLLACAVAAAMATGMGSMAYASVDSSSAADDTSLSEAAPDESAPAEDETADTSTPDETEPAADTNPDTGARTAALAVATIALAAAGGAIAVFSRKK